ncbi:MAG: hypothetical protein LBK47_10455 [Prevotellaceae bacterium]|jgi:hypothetical protein|nr:hypothetical protein [Prevotellaceae bacterium]
MSEKNYVGTSYKVENEKGTFYQFAVKREEIEKLQGVGKRNEITLAIEPKREIKKEKAPTHNVYFGVGDSAHKNREVQLLLSKDALLAAPVDEYSNIRLFAASRSKDKMSVDLSNFSVMLDSKDENDKYVYVGRGYDASTKFGETRVVGVAYKQEFGNEGENGKSYNLNLYTDKVQKLDTNEYGDAMLNIVPYNAPVSNPDGSVEDKVRYFVTEANMQRASKHEATVEVPETNVQRVSKYEATVNIRVHLANTEKVHDAEGNPKQLFTLFDCNIHTVGDNNMYKLIVRDKNPEKIGKDCADLVILEDKYTPEMKFMSPEEVKAAKDAIETIYVGKGWTNDPAKIKLSAADLTQEGLSKAIENNHMVKVIAIVKNSPELVEKNHVEQAQTKSEGLAKWVVNTYNSKQAPPQQYANVKFTDEQLATLQGGGSVKAEGLEFKKGENVGAKVDRWITWDNKTGKCRSYAMEPKPKLEAEQPDTAQKQQKQAPKPKAKAKGIKATS